MKNKLMITGVTVVVLGVIYIAFLYPWPAGQGTEGTIGGVKKYNAHQLAEKDVQLQDISSGTVDKNMILSFYASAPLADREAFEKAAIEKAAVEKAPYEKAAVEKAAVEKAPYEKAAVEKAAVEKAPYEKTAIEKAAVEKAPYEKTAIEKAAVEKAPYEKAAVEKAAVEKAPIERTAGTEKMADIQRTAGVEKSTELSAAIMYWNQASYQAKSEFAKAWLDRSAGLDKNEQQ
jgi:hypothetical protein